MKRMTGVYVTGTDTGIGKTVASCALLRAFAAQGHTVAGMKPVASGCECIEGQWRNEDALALIDCSSAKTIYADHNPHALPAATAPQLAAREVGVEITLAPMGEAYARLGEISDMVVVEGVGGWAAPLADTSDGTLDQADLVRALDVPVVLVVGLRLGCLSHARLSARAVEEDACRLIGWIGNTVDPAFERMDDYLGLLRDALPVPCLGVLPHVPGEKVDAAVADVLATHLQIDIANPTS